GLFVILLAHVYEWTADRDLLVRYLPAAEAAMAWVDRYGDRDGDGFQEYATRSSKGFYNQRWKDAHDAIPDEHGARAGLPLALCELQGYAYDAKLPLARVDARLLADDVWSGWCMHALSAQHPAYNPCSYHTATVWPHDNATIASGFTRYGLRTETARIALGLFEAANAFAANRLPELFSG